MPMQREAGVVTRILSVDTASISFEEDSAAATPGASTSSAHHIETCTPKISSPETLASLEAAAAHMKALPFGEPVAFPTETVYGLGAVVSASTSRGLERIFQLKGRPSDNPLIVHVSSLKMLREQVLPDGYVLSNTYSKLVSAFWPGPLTLLFPAGELAGVEGSLGGKVPRIVTAGHASVAVRMPAHPAARALIAVADMPVAAPSANSSGRPSPTKADHVFHDLSGKVGIILDDGGSSFVGLESTVVDGLHEDGNLRVLRPGGVTVEDLQRVVGDDVKVLVHRKDYTDEQQESAPTTPGMKYRHYAPTVPVILLVHTPQETGPTPHPHPIEDISTLLNSILERFPPPQKITLGLLLTTDSPLLAPLEQAIAEHARLSLQVHPLGTRATPNITAQRLFDGLLTLDHDGVNVILVESVEERDEGLAVMNRVRKAAGETRWVTA